MQNGRSDAMQNGRSDAMGYNHLSNWPRVSAVVSILLLAPLLHARDFGL